MSKILFVTSELFPLIKTGGLADFSASLPAALAAKGEDVVVLLPGYGSVLRQCGTLRELATVSGFGITYPIRLLEVTDHPAGYRLWLLENPELFDREGGPYIDASGQDWQDNALRFGLLCRAASEIALGHVGLDWQPDRVHCNDWQTGLIPALLSLHPKRPTTVFSIHNLAYQGNFPAGIMQQLSLPAEWWSIQGVEFYGRVSFLKAGIMFADGIGTVSPTYAREILSAEFGCGMEGILRERQDRLFGVVNGIDTELWNPLTDSLITANYGIDNLTDKAMNKLALQKQAGLDQGKGKFLIGFVARLAQQKGTDMLLHALQNFDEPDVQWAILGAGDAAVEQALLEWQQRLPNRVFCQIGYSEAMAHQIESSADVFLMPSHYEPCGLNQLYSLRYGTPPLVSATGGLADTVNHCDRAHLQQDLATGFVFPRHDKSAMLDTLRVAKGYFRNKKIWRQIQRCGMRQDLSWRAAVEQYLALYQRVSRT